MAETKKLISKEFVILITIIVCILLAGYYLISKSANDDYIKKIEQTDYSQMQKYKNAECPDPENDNTIEKNYKFIKNTPKNKDKFNKCVARYKILDYDMALSVIAIGAG